MSFIRTIGLVAMTAACAGCATILRGTDTDFVVETTPAGARVELSTGQTCEATPCTFENLPRKSAFTATITRDGYEPITQEITHYWSKRGTTTGIVGNAILGGGIGIGVDAATGANLDLQPNPLVVTLAPAAAPAPEAVSEAVSGS